MSFLHSIPTFPPLPRLRGIVDTLARPLRLLPCSLHAGVLARLLNHIFAAELHSGELNFLQQRRFHLHVSDLDLNYYLTLQQGQLRSACSTPKPDLQISGKHSDLLLLANRKEDADTLFFQRRLRLSGNTELGLQLKNFLDAVDLSGRLGPLEWILQQFVDP
jgi:predicted lipid carrier protein YhbT